MNKLAIWLLIFIVILSGCAAPVASPTQQPQTVATETLVEPTTTFTPTLSPSNTPLPTQTPDVAATQTAQQTAEAGLVPEVIEYEILGSFNFFWEQANTDLSSPGYGLIRDRYPGSEGIASIASVGFGLTAYLVGIEKGYITYDEGYERVNHTLDTLLTLDRTEGFFYHFLAMDTGKRAWESEVSSIDTAILMMGVVSAGQYFGGEIQAKANQLYDDVNWPWFIDEAQNMFYMAYRPGKGFEGHWDFYAEQLMLYILAAGSDTHPIDKSTYYHFTRHYAKYGDGQPFIHSWFGSLFTYQFSHAWIDFREYTDSMQVNWFNNSVEASKAQVSYATNMTHKYKTLSANAWGLTACDGPKGYNGTYGAPPSGYDNKSHYVDDTIPPAGAIGSIIFTPEDSLRAMLNYYSIEELRGQYGFYDAYNLSEDWFDTDVIGIDKGISLLMLANYQDDLVYKVVMLNQNILQGLERLEIVKQ